ncbi:DUF3326 domain-containing protein [Leptolyngbya sp. CCNP1308]|uniref:DUF3326 domain-containing protein n=1 Tax=Leptolyngbya sp. CCNP1308 TaxID=3110255 RepID=UPI002B1F2964|nr:DUF3326 domain-containing protein [Leptolyngbya sp. CCNP1308]MEA5450680.1 DUF3326 domain-containing protein [Leptolyngbya sp. CCNP1308]
MNTDPSRRPYTAVLVVPTGIGAAVGGYAGDALPVARAIASVVDTLITHPNVMNGAQLYWPLPNAYYVEGYGLDQFAAGRWGLRPLHRNRIGLVLDAAIEDDLRWRHLQAADAARATLGLDLTDYVVTDAPLGVELRTAASGVTWGTIGRPDSLLRAAERAIAAGANAIAVVARFPEDTDAETLQDYRQGHGVDPLAGAEAVISHLVVRTLRVPCAHAPALSPLPLDPSISPKSAAEELGHTFLPCVLAGLSRAPGFVTEPTLGQSSPALWADQVDAIVVPASACGGSALLSLGRRSLAIAVEANATALEVSPESLGVPAVRVASYLEAVGLLAAHRAGVHPQALTAQVSQIKALGSLAAGSSLGQIESRPGVSTVVVGEG